MKKKICLLLLAGMLLTGCAASSNDNSSKNPANITTENSETDNTSIELKDPTDASLFVEEGDYLFVEGTVSSSVEGIEESGKITEKYIHVAKDEPIFNSEFLEPGSKEAIDNMSTALNLHVDESFAFSMEGGDGLYNYTYKIKEIIKPDWILTVAKSSRENATTDEDTMAFLNEWVNASNNYGFLLSNYENVCNVDLSELFHAFPTTEGSEITEEDIANVLDMWGGNGEDFELNKATTAELDDYLLQTTGHRLSEMTRYEEDMSVRYCQKNDTYYSNVTDTNYCSFTCLTCLKIGDYKYALCGGLYGNITVLVLDENNLVVSNTMLNSLY